MLALIIGVVFIGLTGVNIAKNGASLVPKVGHEDVLQAARCGISTSSLLSPLYQFGHSSSSPVYSGTFAFVAIFARSPPDTDTFYRLYVTWRDHLGLFTVFCFAFLCHCVLDLASTIVFFVVAYQRDVHPSNEICSGRELEPVCTVPVHLMLVVVTVGLCLFKVIAVCECLRFSILPQMQLTVRLDALYVMYNYRCTLLSRS